MKNVALIAEKIASNAIKIATSGKKLPDEFELKDLFTKNTWEKFPVGARILAGKIFRKYINNQSNIDFVKTSATNHSIYKLKQQQTIYL